MRGLTRYLCLAFMWAMLMAPDAVLAQSNLLQKVLPGGQAPANQQLNAVLQQLQQKDGEISNLQSQLTKQDDVVGGLTKQLSSQQGLVGALQDKLSEQGGVLSALQAQLGEKDGLLSALQSQLGEKDGLLSGLQAQLGEKDGLLSTLQSQLGEKDGLLSGLESQLGEKDGLLTALQAQLGDKDGLLAKLKGQIDESADRVGRLTDELASTSGIVEDLRGEIGKRADEAGALLARANDLSDQIATARQAIAVKDRVIGEVEDKLAGVSKQLDQVIVERDKIRSELEAAEKRATTLQKGLGATERLANQRANELASATDSQRLLERKLKAAIKTADGLTTQRMVLGVLLGLAVIGLLWGWLRRPKANVGAASA